MLLDSVGQFTFLAGRGYERWSAGVELPRISVDPQQHEIFQAILRTRQSMMIPETRGYSGWERWPSTDHVRSFLGVPLLVADRVIGVFCVDKAEPHFFTSEHIRLAETLAVDGAIAIQHSRLFEQVRVGRERLEHLSQQLLQVQEAERRQIARELHDEIGQALTALKINMQALQRVLSEEAMVRRVDESIAIIDQTLRQVRDLSLQLRPSLLDDLGLGSALRWYVTRLAERTGIEGKVTIENSESRYGPEIETTGFRVAQEALTNVVRHAQAKHIWVGLRHTLKELELVVRDDGRGFDVAATHERAVHGQSLGILGMQERILLAGGELEITSTPGQGTEVRARLPLDPSLRHIERRGKRRE
jgi:signal transduction histidine kinase